MAEERVATLEETDRSKNCSPARIWEINEIHANSISFNSWYQVMSKRINLQATENVWIYFHSHLNLLETKKEYIKYSFQMNILLIAVMKNTTDNNEISNNIKKHHHHHQQQ